MDFLQLTTTDYRLLKNLDKLNQKKYFNLQGPVETAFSSMERSVTQGQYIKKAVNVLIENKL